MATRKLYTDDGQQIFNMHAPVVLNSIHPILDQSDLAQRSLQLCLEQLPESRRKSEVELLEEFQNDLPAIQRGLFDLIAEILTHLPSAEVTNPERMIDFVKWLSAMEKADGAPTGVYQKVYSEALNQGQLDSLLENTLAAALIEFAENLEDEIWSGTPAELLTKLNCLGGSQRSKDWPPNAIALSKRIISLQAGLLSQGISVDLSRGKHRNITITLLGK